MFIFWRRFLCQLGMHSFADSDATYCADGNLCIETRTCRFCVATSSKNLRHDYGPDYISPGSCSTQNTCNRCGYVSGPIYIEHVWGKWKGVASCIAKRRRWCERCGREEQEGAGHTFVDKGPSGHRCSVCGLKEPHLFDDSETYEVEGWDSDNPFYTTTATDEICSACGRRKNFEDR